MQLSLHQYKEDNMYSLYNGCAELELLACQAERKAWDASRAMPCQHTRVVWLVSIRIERVMSNILGMVYKTLKSAS